MSSITTSTDLSGIRLAAMGDSPKKQTGFGVVNKEIFKGFHEAGADVHAYGFLDNEPDDKNLLPYHFKPTPRLDDLAHQTYAFFLREVKPDIVYILTDPGNIVMYLHGIVKNADCVYNRNGKPYSPPVVVYTPIEGKPSPSSHGEALDLVQQTNGHVVVYCQSARWMIKSQFPDIQPSIVYHGLDHADFRPYSAEERTALRSLIGWHGKFVIGSFGVNKRTKGFPVLIYTAQYLRSIGEDKDILFYCHTNPHEDRMWGYQLCELTEYYGVKDMFVFKPDIRQGYWDGIEYTNGTVDDAIKLANKMPPSPQGRGYLFAHYDLVSRYNCLDLYVDASQIEGWGLPLGEAMACGIPAISVHDRHVRDEIYGPGAYMIDPLPPHTWDTWHSGMRLVTIDPAVLAEAIINMRNDKDMRAEYARKGLETTRGYSWNNARASMNEIIRMTYDRHIQTIEQQP